MDQVATTKRKTGIGTEISKTLVSLAVLGVGIACFVVLYNMREKAQDKDSDVLIPLASVVQARHYEGKLDLLVSGSVQPAHEIKLTTEINGTILTKYSECEAGTYVTKGTKLLEVDPKDYQFALASNKADLKQAEKMKAETQADIDGAKRNIELAQQDLELLQKDHQRNLGLLKRGGVSQSEVDQSNRAGSKCTIAADNSQEYFGRS